MFASDQSDHFNLTRSRPPTKVQLARSSMKPELNIGQIGELRGIVDPTMRITPGVLPAALFNSTLASIRLMDGAAGKVNQPRLERRGYDGVRKKTAALASWLKRAGRQDCLK
jgi:hypothetical protein